MVLYFLGWSSYNQELDYRLLIFLVFSIVASLSIGYINRKKFCYKKLEDNCSNGRIRKKKYTHQAAIIIVVLAIADFVYSGQIPLFSIIRGSASYGDYEAIPLLHSLLENLILFYSAYYFYLYIETKNRKYIIDVISITGMLLLMFHKGTLLFCLFMMANLFLSKLRLKHKLLTPKRTIILIIVIFLVIYINGGLANIRTGYAWNNGTFITHIGGISTWPFLLPSQFA